MFGFDQISKPTKESGQLICWKWSSGAIACEAGTCVFCFSASALCFNNAKINIVYPGNFKCKPTIS